MQKIFFHTEEIDFKLTSESKSEIWLTKLIDSESKITGEINYIFCSDDYLHKLNLKHLNHDTFTDVITFDYVENGIISGDIFISITRVKQNAYKYNVLFEKELSRVMAHGILHLLGYNDKSDDEKLQMRERENFALDLLV